MATGNRPDHEWLNDSVLPNRFHQLGQRVSRKIFAWLERTRHDRRQFDALNFFSRFGFEPNTGGPRADQRAETFAESRLRHGLEVIGSRSPTQTALVGRDSVEPQC